MRARNIKPGFFKNDALAELDFAGRLLFIGLWGLADREGRLEDRPKKVKAEVFPYDEVDVDEFLTELAKRNFILRYCVEGGRYIQIVHFDKHQNPHPREAPSTIPAPAGSCQGNAQDMPIRAESPSLTTESSFLTKETPLQGLLTTTTTTTSSTANTNTNADTTPSPIPSKETEEFGVVVDLINRNICMVSNQVETDLIRDWLAHMPPGWVPEAINLAGLGKARSIKYVDKILQSWTAKYKLGEKPWEVEANGRSRKNGLSFLHRRDPTAADYERDRAKVGWGA